MSDKRTVKFYYYKPYLYKEGKKERPFNFAEWIINFENQKKICDTIQLSSIMARVDGHIYNEKENLHGVCFVNMRGENLPSKVREGVEQEDLDLDDNEYIGEDMYVLYDRTRNIFVSQSNRMSLTINRIAEFINKTKEQDETKVGFLPIAKNLTRKELSKKRVRAIEICCESIYNREKINSDTLKSICDSTANIGCSTYSFKLSVGRKKKAELSPEESQKIIDDIINRNISVKSAKVSLSDQLTGDLEYVDLIENRLCSIIECNVGKRERLHLNKIFKEMVNEYLNIRTSGII